MNRLLYHLPNLLTALRLCAAPFTAILILRGSYGLALAVFVFAGISDALDGYLARRLSPGSQFGVYLDPAADKLLMLASFVTLTMIGAIPIWLTALIIGRDLAIVMGVAAAKLLSLPLEVAPLAIGKASTVIQVAFVALVLLLLATGYAEPEFVLAGAIATGAVTLASWIAYAQLWFRALALGRRTA
ncbi:MAG TPA: CDP-alcohol phosphatidyltransferase family protein [Rhizomicrobium sp.]|jgi:cardiolipin synthase|nr:CDP-alcohol phosphatidyltransferase family protein [Rhizomicrobium sp.]